MANAKKAYKMIDVSANQGAIDWPQVKLGGIEAAVIRGGFWRTKDIYAEVNFTKAAASGMQVGAYWFLYSLNEADAAAEADACASLLRGKRITLPVFADFEYDTERYAGEKGVAFTKEMRTSIIRAFCERIRKKGYVPGVYMNPDYIYYRVNYEQLKSYPLMLAQWVTNGYVSHDSVDAALVSRSFGDVAAWQIGKGRNVPGIKTDVDIDFGYIEPTKESLVSSEKTLRAGDRVRVANYQMSFGKKIGRTYTGGYFVAYYDVYDVISVSGDRVVIGIGKIVTAAVNRADLVKA